MPHLRIRRWALVVVTVALTGEALTPSPALAEVFDDGSCADSCLAIESCNNNPGASCTVEDCYDNMNRRHDYVVRCNIQ